jgi:hypothetical protein
MVERQYEGCNIIHVLQDFSDVDAVFSDVLRARDLG